ncbi:hypothetical protein [Taklimakanibacter lacteus]
MTSRKGQALGHPILEGRHMLDGQVEPIWDYLGMAVGGTVATT